MHLRSISLFYVITAAAESSGELLAGVSLILKSFTLPLARARVRRQRRRIAVRYNETKRGMACDVGGFDCQGFSGCGDIYGCRGS